MNDVYEGSTTRSDAPTLASALCDLVSGYALVFKLVDGAALSLSDALCRKIGRTRESAAGQFLWRDVAQYARFRDELDQRNAASRVMALVTPSGSVDLLLAAKVVRSGDERLVVAHTPNSDRSELEAARSAVATELSVVLRTVGDGVIATDGWGRVLAQNPVAERLTGWRARDAIGRPLREVFRVVRPGRSDIPDPFSDVLNRRQDASFWPRAVLTARDGTERDIAESVAALKRPDGDGFGVVVVFRDVTAQSRLESELQKNQRLEALGLLASGIAHDINNVLTGIFGNLGVARERTDDAFMQSRLLGAERATASARAMTRQLLSLARESEPTRTTVLVDSLLRDAVAIGLSGSTSRAAITLEDESFAVHVDATQISRVVQNLLLNAAQATPEGGAVEVSATRVVESEVDDGEAFVRIAVRDHGPGIPAEIRSRIFEPYFTTKPSGSGLGLAVAQSIIVRQGGWIDFHSTPGDGATFEFYLPLVPRAAVATPVQAPSAPRLASAPAAAVEGSEPRVHVLLLEDDPIVTEATIDMLEQLGCTPVHAESGEQALASFQRARAAADGREPFDLLLMDLTVRGAQGGRACLAQLRAEGCTAPAILTSGFANADDVTWQQDGFAGALPKPYSLDELRRWVQGLVPCRAPSEPAREHAPASFDGQDDPRTAAVERARRDAFAVLSAVARHELSTILHVGRAALDTWAHGDAELTQRRLAGVCDRAQRACAIVDGFSPTTAQSPRRVSRLGSLQHAVLAALRTRHPSVRIDVEVSADAASAPLLLPASTLSLALLVLVDAFVGSGDAVRVLVWCREAREGWVSVACGAAHTPAESWQVDLTARELERCGAALHRAVPVHAPNQEPMFAFAITAPIARGE